MIRELAAAFVLLPNIAAAADCPSFAGTYRVIGKPEKVVIVEQFRCETLTMAESGDHPNHYVLDGHLHFDSYSGEIIVRMAKFDGQSLLVENVFIREGAQAGKSIINYNLDPHGNLVGHGIVFTDSETATGEKDLFFPKK